MEQVEIQQYDIGSSPMPFAVLEKDEDREYLKGFQVKLPIFEGHFDALLDKVERQDVDICDISLTDVTGQYLQYLSLGRELNLAIASEFLFVAAYLIELKSKKLLPEDKIEAEEVEDIESTLIDHILQYKIFKKVAITLRERKDLFSKIYHRSKIDTSQNQMKQIFLKDVSVSDLVSAFRKVWLEVKDREAGMEIVDELITVDEKIKEISIRLENEKGGVAFESLFKTKTRLEVIVTFLALLELVRLRNLMIRQEGVFEQIFLFSRSAVMSAAGAQNGNN